MSSSCGRRRRRTRCQRTGRDGARTDEEDVRRRARRRSIGTNERTTDATRLDDDALHLLVRDVDLERVEHLAPEVLRVDVREVFLVRDHGVRPRCGCVGGGARGGSDDERNARRVTMTRGTFPVFFSAHHTRSAFSSSLRPPRPRRARLRGDRRERLPRSSPLLPTLRGDNSLSLPPHDRPRRVVLQRDVLHVSLLAPRSPCRAPRPPQGRSIQSEVGVEFKGVS